MEPAIVLILLGGTTWWLLRHGVGPLAELPHLGMH
jgi:hypothetical protein